MLAGRADLVSDEALVGLVIGGGRRDAGRAVMESLPRPDALWRATAEDLVELPGVGVAGAARLLACLELSRRAAAWPAAERPTVTTPQDVVKLCATQLRGLDREHFWALALSTKNQLLRMVEVSVGSLSGDPNPSGADIQLTRRLAKAGDVLGIELLDHVVIGDGGAHASLRDMGVL